MDSESLRQAIRSDLEAGYLPIDVIACTGATGMGACDDIAAVIDVAQNFDLYVHVDAAWAGSAMICSEFRALWQGVEKQIVLFSTRINGWASNLTVLHIF